MNQEQNHTAATIADMRSGPFVPGRNTDPEALTEKKRHLREPHVLPFTLLADSIADAEGMDRGLVPYVDPQLGGVDARVLVLLDNPSTKAEAGTGSGLLSLENDDRTAKNCAAFYNDQRRRARPGTPDPLECCTSPDIRREKRRFVGYGTHAGSRVASGGSRTGSEPAGRTAHGVSRPRRVATIGTEPAPRPPSGGRSAPVAARTQQFRRPGQAPASSPRHQRHTRGSEESPHQRTSNPDFAGRGAWQVGVVDNVRALLRAGFSPARSLRRYQKGRARY